MNTMILILRYKVSYILYSLALKTNPKIETKDKVSNLIDTYYDKLKADLEAQIAKLKGDK